MAMRQSNTPARRAAKHPPQGGGAEGGEICKSSYIGLVRPFALHHGKPGNGRPLELVSTFPQSARALIGNLLGSSPAVLGPEDGACDGPALRLGRVFSVARGHPPPPPRPSALLRAGVFRCRAFRGVLGFWGFVLGIPQYPISKIIYIVLGYKSPKPNTPKLSV
jgi:hypothetical protein